MALCKICPNCRRQNSPEAQWCPSCGTNISFVEFNRADREIDQIILHYGSQNIDGEHAKQQIINAIQMRNQTDRIIPFERIIIPTLALGLLFSGLIGYFNSESFYWKFLIYIGLALLLISIFYFSYILIDRQNKHIKREAILRASLIDYILARAREMNKEQLIAGQIINMQSINQEASYREYENNPILISMMSVIPILNFYPLYALNEFSYEHDGRWHSYSQQAQYALAQIGVDAATPNWRIIPQRPSDLYIILSIITLGIFPIFWLYVLIKDPNMHYQDQWQFESRLLQHIK